MAEILPHSAHGYGLLSADSLDMDEESEVEVGEAAPFGSERSDRSVVHFEDEILQREAKLELADSPQHSTLQLLWTLSLGPAFLRSKFSRRELWRMLLPLLGLGLSVLNLLAGSGLAQFYHIQMASETHESSSIYPQLACYSDVAMLFLMLLASRLPPSSLWSDVLIMSIMGAYGVICSFLEMPQAMLETETTANRCADLYRVLVVLTFISSGVHMCAVGGFLLISASALPMVGAAQELPRLAAGLVAYVIAGASYLHAFNLFREAEQAVSEDPAQIFTSIGVQADLDPEPRPEPEKPKAPTSSLFNADGELVVPSGLQHLSVAAQAALRARHARLAEEAKQRKDDKEGLDAVSDVAELAFGVDAQDGTQSIGTDVSSLYVPPMSHQPSSHTHRTSNSSLRYSKSSYGSRLSKISPWSTGSDSEKIAGGRKVGKATLGVQTEIASLSVTICRRCMRPPSLPFTEFVAKAGSGRSSRDERQSQRSSRTVRSAMRVLGKISRKSKDNPTSECNAEKYDDATPMVNSFKITQMMSVSLSLQWAMKHWNMPRIVGTCCPWHTAVLVARKALEDLDANTCDPLWSSLTGWQCSECTCLNHLEVHRCDMCLETKPSSSTGQSSGGSSEQPSTYGGTCLDLQSLPSSTQQQALRFAQSPIPMSEGDGEHVRQMLSGASACTSSAPSGVASGHSMPFRPVNTSNSGQSGGTTQTLH